MNPIIRIFAFFCRLGCEYRVGADYPTPTEGDFTIRDFKFAIWRNTAGVAHPLSDAGKTGERCAGQNNECGSDHARDNRQRRAIYSPGICRRTVWKRSTARRDEIFHRVAGRNWPRQIEQAERRHARKIPALRLPRHGGGGLSIAHRRPRRESRATGDGNVDGRNAYLAVGRAASRFHGCAHATGEFADADFGTQPRVASHGHRRHPQ